MVSIGDALADPPMGAGRVVVLLILGQDSAQERFALRAQASRLR